MIQFSWVAESGLDGTAGEVIALAANQERDRVAGRRRQPNQVESNSIEPSAFGLFARPRKKADVQDQCLRPVLIARSSGWTCRLHLKTGGLALRSEGT